MLVLSRRKDEKIIIDGNITLMVIDISGDKVRIGIDAPKEVPVHREEVWLEIQKSKQPDQIREQIAKVKEERPIPFEGMEVPFSDAVIPNPEPEPQPPIDLFYD